MTKFYKNIYEIQLNPIKRVCIEEFKIKNTTQYTS